MMSHGSGSSTVKVFLSYAREDSEIARRVVRDLAAHEGIEVWFDRQSLLPGSDWMLEIAEAIEQADVIVLLLSHSSVGKTGYVQKEIKDAVARLEYLPSGGRLVLPVRLDDCDVRNPSLRRLTWVDLFPDWDAGFESLTRGIVALAPARPVQPTHKLIVFGQRKIDGESRLVDLAFEPSEADRNDVVIEPLDVSTATLPTLDVKHVRPGQIAPEAAAHTAFHKLWGSAMKTEYYRKPDWMNLQDLVFGGRKLSLAERQQISDAFRRLWSASRALHLDDDTIWQFFYDNVFNADVDYPDLERMQKEGEERRKRQVIADAIVALGQSRRVPAQTMLALYGMVENELGIESLVTSFGAEYLLQLRWSLQGDDASLRQRKLALLTPAEMASHTLRLVELWEQHRHPSPT